MSESTPEVYGDFDVIILGTGLKECILSGLMSSVFKKKVLHMDRNGYYGGESASLNLTKLFEQYKPEAKEIPSNLGNKRDYNVDLCPKFLMACGDLVKVLLATDVTKYLQFRSVHGSYVFHKNAVHKVPSTAKEGLSSGLLSFTQKIRFRAFINFVAQYDENDAKTHEGLKLKEMTMAQVYKYYKLDTVGQTFVSHALALEADSAHLSSPAHATINKIKTYAYSVARFGNSPYIYPVYGLGGLPESFSRLSAINQGTFMLNADVKSVVYDSDGKASGVTFSHEAIENGAPTTATAKTIIGEPSYFEEKLYTKTGQTARCIVIMSQPLPGTNEAGNCQVIIPNVEAKRQSDVYISCLSDVHQVCPQRRFLAVLSATVEGGDVDVSDRKACADACARELKVGLGLIPSANILEKFTWVTDTRAPTNSEDLNAAGIYMTATFDATSHFQSATAEVLSLYESITGSKLDLNVDPDKIKDNE